MTNGSKIDKSLWDMIPSIKRCRDYHLYDHRGNRFLDLYLDEGRALMGHKPGKVMLPVKNSLEKGLWAPYPTVYEHRLKKQLGQLFPDRGAFKFYSSLERAEAAFDSLENMLCWQPLTDEAPDSKMPMVMIPPVPGFTAVIVSLPADSEADFQSTLREDALPGYILEGLIRGFHDYERFSKEYNRKLWKQFDGISQWERQGPRLIYTGVPENYAGLFVKALGKAVLLPPGPEIPAFIPSQLSEYELKCIKYIFTNTGGEACE